MTNEIVVILDRSGSMANVKDEMQGGLNTFLEEQKKVPGDCVYTLAQFDSVYELLVDGIDIADAKPIELVPRGMTSLFDAVGKTITTVRARRDAERAGDSGPATKVIVMIVTDGRENNSVEWSGDKVKALCEDCELEGWEILFLGGNIDAIAGAASIGVSQGRAINFDKTGQSIDSVMNVTSAQVANARTTGARIEYTSVERDAVKSGASTEVISRRSRLDALLKQHGDEVEELFSGDHS